MSSAGDVSLRPNIAVLSQLKPKLGADIWMRVRLSAAAYCSYFNPLRRRRLFVSHVPRQRLATANAKIPSGNAANRLCWCTTSGWENRHVAATYAHADQIATLCKHNIKRDSPANVLARLISCPDSDLLAKQINQVKMEDMRIFVQEREEAQTPGARTLPSAASHAPA